MKIPTETCKECGGATFCNDGCPLYIGRCNAASAWDQRHEHGGLRGSIKAHRTNVLDTCNEYGVLRPAKALRAFYEELRAQKAWRNERAAKRAANRITHLVEIAYVEGGERTFKGFGTTRTRALVEEFAKLDGVRGVRVWKTDGDLVDVTDIFLGAEAR